jgi:ABC-2 type transport system permease protein
MTPTRRFVHDTGLVFARTAREAIGNASLAFGAPTLIAVFLVVLFQGVYGKIADTAGWPTDDFLDWVAPGAVLLSVFVGAGYTAGSLLRDVDSGYLDRVRLLPTNPATVLVGKVAFEAARAVVPATAVLLIALAMGADNRNGLPGAMGVVAIAVALAVAWKGVFYLWRSPRGTTPRCSGSNRCSCRWSCSPPSGCPPASCPAGTRPSPPGTPSPPASTRRARSSSVPPTGATSGSG